MSDSLVILSDDDDQSEEIPEVDPMIMNTMVLSTNVFKDDPAPSFQDLAGSNETLQKIAENMQIILDQDGFVKYGKENRRDLSIVIRTFIYQAAIQAKQSVAPIANVSNAPTKSQKNSQNASHVSQEDFQKLTKELLKAQQEAAELDNRYKVSERIQEELRNDIKSLHAENENLFKQNAELLRKISDSRREFDTQILGMKQECEKAEDSVREMQDKLQMSEFSTKRLERQLEDANKDLAAANANLVMTRSKLESKSMKVSTYKQQTQNMTSKLHNVESENEELRLQLGDLMAKLESMSKELEDLEPEKVSAEREEHERIAHSLKSITDLCQAQADEIVELQKLRAKSVALIQKQNNLIQAISADLEETKNECTQVRERSIDLEEKCKTQTIIERDNLDPIKEMLHEQFGDLETNEDVKECIQKLLSREDGEVYQKNNAVLLNIIENQLRFIGNLAKSGEIQLFLLSSPEANETLLETQSFKQDIIVEIARCRQFLAENDLLPEDQIPASNMAALEVNKYNNNEEKTRTQFDIASFATLSAELIRRLSESLVDEHNNLIEQINEAASIAGIENNDPVQIAEDIVAKFKTFRQFAKAAHDASEGQFDFNNFDESVGFAGKYIQRCSQVLRALENELRPVINFDGETDEIPAQAALFIKQMMKEIEDMEIESVNDMRKQLQEVREELESEKENSTNIISKLETQLQETTNELKDAEDKITGLNRDVTTANQQIEDLKTHRSDLENKLQLLHENYAEIEQDLLKVRQDNETLRNESIARQKKYDERVNNLLEEERTSHVEDVEQIKRKYETRLAKLQKELETKSAKLSEAKAALKQLISEYDAAFRKQKEATAALRLQNQTLITRLSEPVSNVSKKSNREEALQSEIKGLQAEKQVLLARIEQLTSGIEEAQAARDNYWQSQMALRENEVEQSKKEAKEAALESHTNFVYKLCEIVEQFAPRDFESTEEEALAIVKDISDRLSAAQSELDALKKRPATPKKEEKLTEQVSRAVAALKSVAEWEKWARNIIITLANEEPPSAPNQMRKKIGDLAIAGVAGESSRVISSLRSQKQFLLQGAANTQALPISAKGIALATRAAVRISKNAGNNTSIVAPNSKSSISFH